MILLSLLGLRLEESNPTPNRYESNAAVRCGLEMLFMCGTRYTAYLNNFLIFYPERVLRNNSIRKSFEVSLPSQTGDKYS